MKFPTFRTFHRFSSAPPLCAPWLVRGATSHCVEYKSKGFDYNVRRNRRNATTVLEITPLSTERKREREIARGWSRFYLNRYCCIRLGSFVLSSPLSFAPFLLPPSFSLPYLPRNEHRIDFHLG